MFHIQFLLINKHAVTPWLNKPANGVPSDLAHRLYQDVLDFINIIHCHGTCINVISLMPLREIRPSLHQFSRNSQTAISNYIHITYNQISSKSTRNAESTKSTLFTSTSKLWVSLCWVKQNSLLLSKNLWTSPWPNIFQIHQVM